MARPATDRGVVTAVELMFLLIFCLAGLAFVGFLGRLHAAGIEVATMSQSAARAASLATDATTGRLAAQDAIERSTLGARCTEPPAVTMSWLPSPTGAWQGGSVTVTVSCRVDHETLGGLALPGSRLVRMSDTQPIDRYQR